MKAFHLVLEVHNQPIGCNYFIDVNLEENVQQGLGGSELKRSPVPVNH